MKIRKTYILAGTLAALLCSSCDSHKSAAKQCAETFAKAINEGDNVTLFDVYPALINQKDLDIVSNISLEGMQVEAISGDSLYEVKLANEVTLVVAADGDGMTIVDSHKVLHMPEYCVELAGKTGVPLKKLSDRTVSELFDEESNYIQFLSNEDFATTNNLNISISNGRYSWTQNFGNFTCVMTNNITNNGKKKVSGSDYEVEHIICNKKDFTELLRVTTYGRDLEPGETTMTTDDIRNLFSVAKASNLTWSSNVKLKRSKTQILAKYGNFKGDEYKRYKEYNVGGKE